MRTLLTLPLVALMGCVVSEPGSEPIVEVAGAQGQATFSFACPSGEFAFTEEDAWRHLAAAPRLVVGSTVGHAQVVSPFVPGAPDGEGVRLLAPGRLTLVALADDGALLDLIVVQAETPARVQLVRLTERRETWSDESTSRSSPIDHLEITRERDVFLPHRPIAQQVVLDLALVAEDGAPLCGTLPWQASLTPPLWELSRSGGERGALGLLADAAGEAVLEITLGGTTVQIPVVVR